MGVSIKKEATGVGWIPKVFMNEVDPETCERLFTWAEEAADFSVEVFINEVAKEVANETCVALLSTGSDIMVAFDNRKNGCS